MRREPDGMLSLGILGAGQFSGSFATLFRRHPDVSEIWVADLRGDRAADLVANEGLDGTLDDFESMLASDVDAVAIFTQRWTHGPLVVQALRAGKHVYSAVPMAVSVAEVEEIIAAVRETGLIYMMGETSFYNPATIFARLKLADGDFGRVFYSEGDYVHDMDLGFYAAYQYSGGGENWKTTASYPPMLYPTHSRRRVLGALDTYAVSVSCLGVRDRANDGVFDRTVSHLDNDISNASALFELADGGVMRINEMRRVGYPAYIRESRFRFFGTEGSFEQLAEVSVWQDKERVTDVSNLLHSAASMSTDDPALEHVAPELREAFISGHAPIHDTSRLPASFSGAPNGHEGSHHPWWTTSSGR